MSWSNNAATVLVIMAVVVSFAGGAAGVAILIQIFRQGGWKLAERSVRQSRWRMVRPWLLVGGGIGLLCGFAIVVLRRIEPTAPAAPTDVISAPTTEVKPRSREGGQPFTDRP
jgi:phosphate/sulfate permease